MDTTQHPDGLMVLAFWVEPTAGPRVRITRSTRTHELGPATSYASDRAELLLAVARWWDGLMTSPPGRP